MTYGEIRMGNCDNSSKEIVRDKTDTVGRCKYQQNEQFSFRSEASNLNRGKKWN